MGKSSRQARKEARILKRLVKQATKLYDKQKPYTPATISTPTKQATSTITYGYPSTKGFTPKQTIIRRSSGGSQILQVSPSQTPTQFYGELSPANQNLMKLRSLSLQTIRENFAKRNAERLILLRRNPRLALRKTREGLEKFPFKVAGGVGVVLGGVVEMKTERITKLKTEIEKREREGKFPIIERGLRTKLQIERGVVASGKGMADLISILPKLPEATALFVTNQPISKIRNSLRKFNRNKIGKETKQTIINNPFGTASRLATDYFLFGNKLFGKGKLKPKAKIEKIIIKENRLKNFQDGLFFKWVSKERPILIQFKTQLNINLSKLKARLNKISFKYKQKKTSESIKPNYKDVGFIDNIPRKPEPKPKPTGGGKGKGDVEISFTNKITTLPLKEQVKFIGKKLNLVSAQANRLVYLLRRSRLISKPATGLKLKANEIKLLNKLNKGGRLTRVEVGILDKAFRRTNKGLLEKSFFASPSTKVRTSRLGLNQGEAGLIDVFKGNFALRRNKPQILLFVNQRIQSFPKNLKGIQKKLLSGKSLTNAEKINLLSFQLKKSGRFKPIGFLTREAEVTLSPNEIIKRIKKLTSVRIGGRSVPIVQAEVTKIQSKLTKDLMNRINKGQKLSKSELNKLNKGIQKESGFKSSYSYSGKNKPYLNLKSKLLSFVINYQPKKSISYFPRGTSPYKPKSPVPRPRGGSYPYKPKSDYTPKPKYTPRGTPPYKPTPTARYKPKPLVYPRFSRTQELKKGKDSRKMGFIAYGLSGGKWFKLNKKPLLKPDALSRGSYAIDRTTARTFKIVPVGKAKSFGGLVKREKGYFTKTQPKFREFKIRKGKAYITQMKLIEKRKYAIDTTGEKKGLSLARYLKKMKGGKY